MISFFVLGPNHPVIAIKIKLYLLLLLPLHKLFIGDPHDLCCISPLWIKTAIINKKGGIKERFLLG